MNALLREGEHAIVALCQNFTPPHCPQVLLKICETYVNVSYILGKPRHLALVWYTMTYDATRHDCVMTF